MAGDREKFSPKTNVPEQIALKYATGREMSGAYGDSVMFTLADERVWFATPIVARKIYELGIEAGELFEVCKEEVTQGNRRTVRFNVRRLEVEEELAATKSTAPTTAMVKAAQQTPAVQQIPPVQPAAIYARIGEEMTDALCAAVDAARTAEEHAAKTGYSVRFSSEDIRTVGNTIFIRASEARAKWHAA